MSYTINTFDGSVLTTVNDGTINKTLDINLIGRNYAGYGDPQNENFVFLLENFARNIEPPAAIRGQLWFDTTTKRLKVYTGDQINGAKVWKTAGGLEYGIEPNHPSLGDMWFDTVAGQLKVWATVSNVTSWVQIGPPISGGQITQMVSKQLKDTLGTMHYVILATVFNAVVYVISNSDFTIDPTDTNSVITGYSHIHKGMTMPYTNETTGQGSNGYLLWGTASDANSLGGVAAADYAKLLNPMFSGVVNISDKTGSPAVNAGLVLGDTFVVDIDKTYISNKSTPAIKSSSTNLLFKVNRGNTDPETMVEINSTQVLPGIDSIIDLGSDTKKWKTVNALNFNGNATSATTLKVNGVAAQTGDVVATANTIAARDSFGNLTANQFNGVATSAKYADLAEKYLPDHEYEVGTVVVVGGDKEITASTKGDRAIGVISGKPAFRMNEDLVGGQFVALKGRVPVKTVGKIKKGDRMVAANNGCAQALSLSSVVDNVFAIALESSDDAGVKFVEAIIL